MANGFATGVSSTPLDIASAGQIFMRSAVETRLAEIQANKLEVSENVEKALKAMSISTIEGLSQNMRVRYQKEIEKYRDNVRNKLISNQGKLSLDDEREIQDGFVDLQKRQAADVYQLKQLAQAQDLIVKDINSYDPRAIDELRQMEEAMDKGELVGDPMTVVLKNRVPASVGDIVSKFYGHELAMLGKMAKGGFSDNVFSQTEMVGLVDPNTQKLTDKATNLRERLLDDPRIAYRYTKPDGSFDEEAYAGVKQEIEDNITQVIKEVKPYRQSTGTDRYRNAVNYNPTPLTYGEDDYDLVRVPSNVSQTDRNFLVNGAKNLDTGQTTQLTEDNAKIVGVDVDKGVVLLEGKGAFAQRGGEDLFLPEGVAPTKRGGDWSGQPESSFTDDSISERLKSQYDGEGKVEDVKNVSKEVLPNGDIKVSGTLVVGAKGIKGLWKGDKEMPVSTTYKRFVDPSTSAIYEAPLQTNKEAVANMFGKVLVRGVPLENYFTGKTETKETGNDNGEGKPMLSVSKYNEAKGKNYTKAQVQAQFGDQYKIVD